MQERIVLSEHEKSGIEAITGILMFEFDSVECREFARRCAEMSADLPVSLRRRLKNWKDLVEGGGFRILKGFEVDDTRIGPSPANWDAPWSHVPYLREEIFQCLITSCLGDIFGYRSLENGRFLRHATPERGKEAEQVAGGSTTTLEWHTEEAFHPCRADFMSIMCYRNTERAVTNVACIDDLELDAAVWEVLRQPRFRFPPDQSHRPEEYSESRNWDSTGDRFRKVKEFLEDPVPQPIVFGAYDYPCMVIDEAFMEPIAGDNEAAAALQNLLEALNIANRPVTLESGDLLIVDNQRAVHGRSSFVPDYGPSKRWLRILYSTMDLRASLAYRDHPGDRVIW